MQIRGACHCETIRFTLDWAPDPVAIAARACTCTFCTKHGAVWTSYPDGVLAVIANPAHVSRYAFGTGTAAFHVCTRCGVAPVATSEIAGRLYAVVNANAFEGVDPALVQRAPITLDAEPIETRLARRARNWIANVTLSASP